jgi:hypothetical protein
MSAYIGNIPVPQATQTRQTFTATSGQTTFNTVGYTAGFVDVYMNGVRLVDGTDFTATNGSTVVLTTGAATGDTIEVVAYSTFQVSDQNFTGTTTVDTLNITGASTGTDLTLSGGVYLGGTGAANKLDDYEEGTYTVNVTDASGNTSSSSFTGYYTKIGNLVEVNFYASNISTVGLVSSDNIHFSLPFAVLANNYGIGSCVADTINFSSGRTQINPRASSTVDYIILRGTGDNITDDGVIVSELTSTVSDIFLSITYRTS